MKEKDFNDIVNIVKAVASGQYVVVYRDTNTFEIHKYNKADFVGIFRHYGEQWIVETDGDIAKFMYVKPTDPDIIDSELLRTFNGYTYDNLNKIAAISVVCDWDVYSLAFNESSPVELLKTSIYNKK